MSPISSPRRCDSASACWSVGASSGDIVNLRGDTKTDFSRTQEARKGISSETAHSFDFECRLGEVQDEPGIEADGVEVRAHDGKVNVVERFDRFELDHHAFVDNEIEPMHAHFHTAVD